MKQPVILREQQTARLENLFASSEPCIFISGQTSTAKSMVTKRILDANEGSVLDHVEELANLDGNLMILLSKLAQLTRRRFCTVFISRLKWDDLLSHAQPFSPPKVDFPVYSFDEAVQIMALDCPPDQEKEFYLSFVQIIYSTFHTACKELGELRYLSALLFPKYIEPIRLGKATKQETAKLFTLIHPVLKNHLESLFLRDVSCIEWQSHLESESVVTTASKRIEMPFLTKFLVIASFLASYNPSKYDNRYFTRGGEGKSKAGRKGGVHNGSLVRTQLTGPKAFPIDRMLAIFYSILEDDCKFTFDIHSQIATLISLRLLVKVSASNRLDSIKCKCNVSFSLVKTIAKSVRFDIMKYLFDFVDT
ncbi:Origin recognition complex subunit 5 [Kappamyces sp. JEL0680]|nr:Origin recognition complex subunit 5 [Kappamyces sp. JEL0680]